MELCPEVAAVREAMRDEERAVFDRLVVIAVQVEPALQNALRWKVPTFTLDDNWHHWLFSIAPTRRGVTLTFHKGRLLCDPHGLLSGEGGYLRLIRFNTADAIDAPAMAALFGEAITHQLDL